MQWCVSVCLFSMGEVFLIVISHAGYFNRHGGAFFENQLFGLHEVRDVRAFGVGYVCLPGELLPWDI